jgi:uncharacterized protein (TIGR04141 family)
LAQSGVSSFYAEGFFSAKMGKASESQNWSAQMDDHKIGLTIFLLKEKQVAAFEGKLLGQNQLAIPLSEPFDGVFLPFPPSNGSQPSWVRAVSSILATPIGGDMQAKSPAGLLILRHFGKTFVISFGHAWQKLEDQWLERDFGLRVALNVIPKNEVVEIKAEQVFAKWHLASERAPRATSVDEFAVDFDRDLVAVVEGVPKSCPAFGKIARGSTSLRLNLPIADLESVLDQSLIHFGSDTYKTDWPDIDKINPVRDETLIELLEDQLDRDLADLKARSRIAMFTPSQRRGESVLADSYVYGRLSQAPVTTPYLTIDGWIGNLSRKNLVPSVAEAKTFPVHILDESGQEAQSCTVFDCFGYEFSDKGQVYVLTSGVWYEVVSDFVARINDSISKIPLPSLTLPAWNHVDKEGQYNAACAANGAFLNCDARNFHYGGGHSQFEFCDLVHLQTRTLLFSKIVSKSSGMSHLVEQVRRTAQLLFSTDDGYRKELIDLFTRFHPTADATWLQSRPRQGDWNLCMVSLGKSASELPFFAKCGLAKIFKDLGEQGHELSFVGV